MNLVLTPKAFESLRNWNAYALRERLVLLEAEVAAIRELLRQRGADGAQ